LDWIVMKALEKDRNRRYETANGLARDLQRYLADEPVQACPPSWWYRFRKFVRRHKVMLLTAVVLALAVLLAVGSVAGSLGWVASDRAARQAALEQEVARALDEVEAAYQHDRLPEALAEAKRAEGLLAGGGSEALGQRVQQWRSDLELVARLEEIRVQCVAMEVDRQFDVAGAERAFREAFRPYGFD